MSRETEEWLNTMTLIGFTDRLGDAWHRREGSNNHFPGPIPVEEVRGLLDWHPVEAKLYAVSSGDSILVPGRKALVHPSTDDVLGIVSDNYQVHPYGEYLVDVASHITNEELGIGSAGLLKKGAVGWVQYELPESIQVAGDTIRPWLLMTTSLDGTVATQARKGCTRVVCDNTLSAALAEKDSVVHFRHTKNSADRYEEMRNALGILITTGKVMTEHVKILTGTAVSETEWEAFLEGHFPVPKDMTEDQLKVVPGYQRKLNSRMKMDKMYRTDERVSPWVGTAWGVLQAVNTWEWYETQHKISTGESRIERDQYRIIKGHHDDLDKRTIGEINSVFKGKRRKQIQLPTSEEILSVSDKELLLV